MKTSKEIDIVTFRTIIGINPRFLNTTPNRRRVNVIWDM